MSIQKVQNAWKHYYDTFPYAMHPTAFFDRETCFLCLSIAPWTLLQKFVNMVFLNNTNNAVPITIISILYRACMEMSFFRKTIKLRIPPFLSPKIAIAAIKNEGTFFLTAWCTYFTFCFVPRLIALHNPPDREPLERGRCQWAWEPTLIFARFLYCAL